VHRVFCVVPELFYEFGAIHIALATLADKTLSLRVELSKKPFPRTPRRECRCQFLELFSDARSDHERIIRQEQQEEYCRVALQRQSRRLAQAVNG
jgi:hypothetical protein